MGVTLFTLKEMKTLEKTCKLKNFANDKHWFRKSQTLLKVSVVPHAIVQTNFQQ